MPRQITQAGLDLIKHFEGFRAKPYLCSAGIPTIGYGHTKGVTLKSPPITLEEAEKLLRSDILAAERSVERLITSPLTNGQFSALVSFVFNLGAGKLQASTLRRKINRGDHAGAVAEFHKWVFAGGKKSKGLITRRNAEARMYAEAIDDSNVNVVVTRFVRLPWRHG